ncbi:MAG: hypothetical protein M3R00_03335, partial [Pseudomonadota bacterium]|nr:hypothetical protein [Pseudomonadota bacterium]
MKQIKDKEITLYKLNYGFIKEVFYSCDKLQHYLNTMSYCAGPNKPVVEIYTFAQQELQLIGKITVDIHGISGLADMINAVKLEFKLKALVIDGQMKTKQMHQELALAGRVPKSGRLTSEKGESLKIVHTHITDFCSEKLVSLGAGIFEDTGREGIVLDPNSPILLDCYEILKALLKKAEPNGFDKLGCITAYLHTIFRHKSDDKIKAVTLKHKTDEFRDKNDRVCALVPLEAFMQENVGVCRHFALLGCHFVHRLINEKLLDCKEVHCVRGLVKTPNGFGG